jgi:hypothetical protein
MPTLQPSASRLYHHFFVYKAFSDANIWAYSDNAAKSLLRFDQPIRLPLLQAQFTMPTRFIIATIAPSLACLGRLK